MSGGASSLAPAPPLAAGATGFTYPASPYQDARARQTDAKLERETEALANRIKGLRPSEADAQAGGPLELTPVRAHYLKKTLIKLQLEYELAELSRPDALSTFGPPFTPSKRAHQIDLPFLRFMFRHFVLTFPFLRSAPPNFFSDKVQVFVDRFLSRNISTTVDREEDSKRRKMGRKLQKHVGLLLNAAVRVKGGREDVVRISEADMRRLGDIKRAAAGGAGNDFDLNVVTVRTVVSKGRVRSKAHEEFIIRTRRPGHPDVFVSRRYGDFGRLAETLRTEFPEEDIRSPPPKDRSQTEMRAPPRSVPGTPTMRHDPGPTHRRTGSDPPPVPPLPPQHGGSGGGQRPTMPPPLYVPRERRRDGSRSVASSSSSLADGGLAQPDLLSPGTDRPYPPSPLSVNTADSFASTSFSGHPQGYQDGTVSQPGPTTLGGPPQSPLPPFPFPSGPLAREKNRLTLRAYLRALLAIRVVADSPAFRDFLLGELTTLTKAEEEDVERREQMDEIRRDEQNKFDAEAGKRVKELESHLSAFKEDLVRRDGLSRVFSTIKTTPNIEDLPIQYRKVMEWARISLASTIYHLFVGSDTSSDHFLQLKRMHGLMPYFMLKGVLRISNPVSMIRAVLDLFLAQPFGQKSLLQRMFSSSLTDDVRELQDAVEAVKAKIEDDVLAEKVRLFVYAPPEVQQMFKDDATNENLDLIAVILRSGEHPLLNRAQIHRVVRANRAFEEYKRYKDSLDDLEEDQGPDNDDAWLFEDLHVLMRMYTRLRDKEQMIELIFEGVTADLLKDMVTIFYSPLAQVYKAANIADSISDLQTFINDLIRTVEASEEVAYTDPQRTVQMFIDLVERNEGRFYNFVHQVHSKGSGLFDGLMHWIELFVNFVRDGLGPPSSDASNGGRGRGAGEVDLEVLLPHAQDAESRKRILDEVDKVAVYHYRLKLAHEQRMRRRLRAKGQEADGQLMTRDDEALFIGAVVDNLGFGDMVLGQADDIAAEESEDEDEDEEDEEEEKRDVTDDSLEEESGAEEDEEVVEVGPDGQERRVRRSTNLSRRWNYGTVRADDEGGDRSSMTTTTTTPVAEKTPDTTGGDGRHGSGSVTVHAAPSLQDRDKDLPPLPPTGKGGASGGKTGRKNRPPEPPELSALPELVPLFVELVRPLLRPARTPGPLSRAVTMS